MRELKLRLDDWPEADQQLWASITTDGGLFDSVGALAHLRPQTLHNTAVSYRRWLSWLKSAEPAALIEPPVDRLSPLRINAWMEDLASLAPYSRVRYLDDIIRFVTASAPERDVHAISRIRHAQFTFAQADNGRRKQGRILCALDLINAGLDHGTVGVENARSEFERARRMRDAAMMVFLAMLPIRRKNFVDLEIGQSIQITPTGLRLVLRAQETKTHSAFEAMIQEPAAALVLRYLCEARPFLLGRGPEQHNQLWVADTGLPYSYGYIGTRIPLLAKNLLGVNVAMHFFRDAVATTFARSSTHLSRGTRAILGHTTFRTAERHYNHSRAIEAGRDYGEVIRSVAGKTTSMKKQGKPLD